MFKTVFIILFIPVVFITTSCLKHEINRIETKNSVVIFISQNDCQSCYNFFHSIKEIHHNEKLNYYLIFDSKNYSLSRILDDNTIKTIHEKHFQVFGNKKLHETYKRELKVSNRTFVVVFNSKNEIIFAKSTKSIGDLESLNNLLQDSI